MDHNILAAKAVFKFLLSLATNISGFVIILTFGCAIFFGIRTISYAQKSLPRDQDGASQYDKRQDDRMDNLQANENAIQAQRTERREETLAHRALYDAKTDDNHDRIIRDEAYFTGAMALLGLLQVYLRLTSNKRDANRDAADTRRDQRERARDERERLRDGSRYELRAQ